MFASGGERRQLNLMPKNQTLIKEMEEEDETCSKFPKCKECNRQRFGHPGDIANFGPRNLKGLTKLEIDSKDLKSDDQRVLKEIFAKRGLKERCSYSKR